MSVRNLGCLGVSVLVALSWPALVAAEGAPVRVRGEIQQLEGQTLTVKGRDGSPVVIALADNFAVSSVVKAELGDIGPGKYVGTAAVPQRDGTLRALEVLIFPDALRGTGEGHFPWDLAPESTMTNATVASVVSKVDDRVMTLTFKDGEKTVTVPSDAPIVTLKPGSKDLLKPGSHVFIVATKRPDGTLGAGRVAVGENGLVPPM